MAELLVVSLQTWGGSDQVAFVGYHGGMCVSHHDSPDIAMEMKRRAKLCYGFNVRVVLL